MSAKWINANSDNTHHYSAAGAYPGARGHVVARFTGLDKNGTPRWFVEWTDLDGKNWRLPKTSLTGCKKFCNICLSKVK